MSIAAAINVARKYANGGAVDTNPSPAQKEAGNYKMRHITFQGIPITIENPKGTIRSGMDANGKFWSNRMTADYGYIKRTEGKDGDQVDAFVGPNKQSDRVFIIDQLHHHMEKFDEHKCLLGFNTRKQALTAYHGSYGRKYGAHHTVGAVTELSVDAFKEWLKGGGGKEPVAPDVPKFQEGGAVADEQHSLVFDPEFVGKTQPAKTPNIRVTEGHQEFEKGYAPSGRSPWNTDYPYRPILNMRGQELDALKIQTGGAVEDPPVEDVPGVGPVPTAMPEMPEPIKAAAKAYSETPSWLEQAQQEEARSKEAFQRSGVSGITQQMAADTGPTQELASGFAGTTIGKAGAAPKLATTIGKTAFDLHPDEVASALQTSGTKGTSAGGTFTGFSDGVDRYVKIAKSLDHAKEEVLASKLYELAGVRAAKTELTQLNGKPAVASQIIPKANQLSEFVPEQYNSINGLKEDFPAHAWLANWDAPGVGSENPLGNIMVAPIGGGQWGAHYVDFGGALRFRGLGGQKGDLFGPKVTETKTMLGDTAKNPLVASVFEGHQIRPDNPVAQRIANISNDQINDLVNTYGPSDPKENFALKAKLVNRRNDLAKQYGIEKPHIVGGTEWKPPPEKPAMKGTAEEYQKLRAEWEAKLAEQPEWQPIKEDPTLEKFADEFFDEAIDEPAIEKYSFKDPQADANKLLYWHHYEETSTPHGVVNPSDYDTKGIAHEMYNMALKNPEYVDQVYKKLPFELQEDVNAHLGTKIQREGDPWFIPPKPKPPSTGSGGTGIGGTVKLMNLNKTHSVDQLVNSIKDYHKSELNVGKTVTAKQKDKIESMISGAPSQKIANAIKGLDSDDQTNVLSWLPAAKASNVKTLAKIDPEKAAQPIPDIDKIQKSHSLYQILGAIKNYSPLQAEVPYHAYQSIPKELSKFSPSEIIKEMEPLSLQQKQKIMQWLPESTQEKMAQIGAEKAAKKQGFIGQEYYDALEPLDWSKYQPKKAQSSRHQFSKTMLEHITSLGFNPDVTLYKGGKHLTYPKTILDPVTEPHRLANPDERAFFLSHDPAIAQVYSLSAAQAPMEYIARPEKVFAVDWKDATGTEDYSSHHMKRFIEAAREKGADLLVVKNVADIGGYGHGLQTQYAFLNTHVLRGPSAKFDVDKLHMRWPLAGLVGGGLFSYGMLRGQEPDQYASGGAVKASKEKAHYRVGTNSEHCGICTMFRAPDSCTAVSGKIRWMDNCDYFEKRK